MYMPAHGVFTLSQRAMRVYVQILHPFTDRTCHIPYLCTCSSSASQDIAPLQFGSVDSPL